MNQIVNINTSSTLTMSSREIAELTKKSHGHVMRDIKAMLKGIGLDQSSFGSVYEDAKGEDRACYHLPKRETLILVSGYSVELRARIIDRWMELEAQAVTSSGRVTATEVTAMFTQYVTDTQEKIVAPLVQAIADLIRNQTPQIAPAQSLIPTADELVPELTAKMVSKIKGVPEHLSNQEIGLALSEYSREHGNAAILLNRFLPWQLRRCWRRRPIPFGR